MPPRYSICFVCAGNICRSPTAEGVMRALLAAHGLAEAVAVSSAGTGGWHVGEAPDPRTCAAAARRGVDLSAQRARQLSAAELDRHDLVLVADRANLRAVMRLAQTPARAEKVRMLRSFDPDAESGAEVPDPYYGDARDFELVLDVCEAACRGVLAHLRAALSDP
jgi:protein-tyrosine phosphatase